MSCWEASLSLAVLVPAVFGVGAAGLTFALLCLRAQSCLFAPTSHLRLFPRPTCCSADGSVSFLQGLDGAKGEKGDSGEKGERGDTGPAVSCFPTSRF